MLFIYLMYIYIMLVLWYYCPIWRQVQTYFIWRRILNKSEYRSLTWQKWWRWDENHLGDTGLRYCIRQYYHLFFSWIFEVSKRYRDSYVKNPHALPKLGNKTLTCDWTSLQTPASSCVCGSLPGEGMFTSDQMCGCLEMFLFSTWSRVSVGV